MTSPEEIVVYDDSTSEKKSSNIYRATYKPFSKTLVVAFKSGTEYTYDEVPEEVVEDFAKAESKGSHFYNNIRTAFKYSQL